MRRPISAVIDVVRTRLGDGGSIVSRAEILEWITDGYARMVREAQTPAVLEAHDVPPRVQYAVTYEWERQYVRGTTRKFTMSHASGRYECTYLHEVSELSEPSKIAVTQLHELDHLSDETNQHYRFALPRRHDLLMLWYDHRILYPVSGRDLEEAGDWWDIEGLPTHYTTDETHNEFDIYRIVTSNHGAYETDRPIGIPRAISGDRSYEIADRGEAGIGVIRAVSSEDRQYHNATPWQRHGTIRHWASSDDNLMSYSVVTPERVLHESDTLDMIPIQLEKYLKFYALAMIHNRQGELYEPNMAEHYRFRYRRGVQLLSRIRNVAWRDTEYGREVGARSPRQARPRLPENYPPTRWR